MSVAIGTEHLEPPLDPLTHAAVVDAVKRGFGSTPRCLPPWLFYDAAGSALFEKITHLPEYYLTRAERSILNEHADDIVATALEGTELPLKVIELGAGSATKTQLLLDAVVRRQNRCVYLPIDVSQTALDGAVARLSRESPRVEVHPFAGTHLAALPAIREMGARRLILFVGSSVGNYRDDEAVALLAAVARELQPGAALLLGTDRRKDVPRMLAAYNDAAGVTAAFNLNLLQRLNRELSSDFNLEDFRHEARWNELRSCVEMHLVSLKPQRVHIPGVGDFDFLPGESIHTESSTKYTPAHANQILTAAGFTPIRTFSDRDELFDLHLGRKLHHAPQGS